jgi:hypothetical protein
MAAASQGLAPAWAAAKPATAPTAIMPSAPRLSTPARSVTSSPRATMISGVPATSVAAMTEAISDVSM